MSDNKDQLENEHPQECGGPMLPSSGTGKRTVMLRVKSIPDTTSLLERISTTGAEIVSEGKGVIVVAADADAIEQLRHDEDVLNVSEERRLEMRMPSMTLKND